MENLKGAFKYHPLELSQINEVVRSIISRLETLHINAISAFTPEENVFLGSFSILKSDISIIPFVSYSSKIKETLKRLKSYPVWKDLPENQAAPDAT